MAICSTKCLETELFLLGISHFSFPVILAGTKPNSVMRHYNQVHDEPKPQNCNIPLVPLTGITVITGQHPKAKITTFPNSETGESKNLSCLAVSMHGLTYYGCSIRYTAFGCTLRNVVRIDSL